jgi:hypothetical protein
MATDMTEIEAFVGRAEGDQFAVVQAKHIPQDKRQRSRLAEALINAGAVKKMLVLEKIDGADAERIGLDTYPLGHQTGEHTEDIVGQIAVASLAMNFLGSARSRGTKLLHHRSADLFSEVTWSDSRTYFEVGLKRSPNNQSFEMGSQFSHAYTQQPQVQIVTSDGFAILASVVPVSELVFSLPGKSCLMVVKLDNLNAGKGVGKRLAKSVDSRALLSPAGQLNLLALVKHVAASLHIAQASIATLMIAPAQGGDFVACEWINHGLSPTEQPHLATRLSSPSLLALSELGIKLGSIVQGFARVLPGVPLRIFHGDHFAEVLANGSGSSTVSQLINAQPVMHGRLFLAAL